MAYSSSDWPFAYLASQISLECFYASDACSLENPDQDVELKRNILAHLIHQIKIPPRGHGELEYYDPQQHLPMVIAKNAEGGSQDSKSRLPALQVVTPRGIEPPLPG